MRATLAFLGVVFFCSSALFAQSDRGTITGTVSDPAGAVVANAAIEARNTETGAVYPVATTATGNYTIPGLPAGTYEVTVTVPGFKKLVRPGLIVQAAQTIRVDAAMEVGAATESVTITEEAPLLKTESGELSQTVEAKTMDALPLLQVGASSSGLRNPYAIVALLPGAYFQPVNTSFTTGPTVRVNGGATSSETFLVDGLDGSNLMGQVINQQTAPSMDSVQEWTVQTSNYAAEFGQAGSSVHNVTMKSGTNEYHGSAYDYFLNEFLNSGQPFTAQPGNPTEHTRPEARRNDWGLTLGGPIRIPKIYDGRNKTFFFFNWEEYINTTVVLPGVLSVPTDAYRQGNFSGAILAAGSKNLGTDPLGRAILANAIYDPTTARSVNGQSITDPFPNNTIPLSRFDPVSAKIQSLMPQPFCVAGAPCNPAGVVGNFQNTEPYNRNTTAPSLKLDQLIGTKDKISFFWGATRTYTATYYGADGYPEPISDTFGGNIYSQRERMNYDHTITPTLLLHLGAGWDADDLGRVAVIGNYNACTGIGLCSAAFTPPNTFPLIAGLSDSVGGGFGSATQPLGPPERTDSLYEQFSSIASLTWVKGNHTFKFGGELRNGGVYAQNYPTDDFSFSSGQTAMPYLVNTSTVNATTAAAQSSANVGSSHIGFPYASFLLGAVDTANIDPPSRPRYGKQQWGFYAQDSWKITRKLTMDYGLRYDYMRYYKEQYGRAPNFAPNVPNPTAGGEPGADEFPSTCHCSFTKNYPFAFGPRIGMAYQVAPKTVLRAGFGIVYASTAYSGATGSASASNPLGPASIPGNPIMTWGQGVSVNGQPLTQAQIAWPNESVGYYPIAGIIPGTGPQYYDPNAGRPARQEQWSVSIQRELARNLVVEASYIGNRGAYWTAGGAPAPPGGTAALSLVNYNYLSTSLLNHYGLSLSNPADLAELIAPLNSPAAGPFEGKIPFTGFPLTATVAQSLRPFPQFNAGLGPVNPPLGDTWYNAAQLSVTKRLSYGLQANFGFTWQKSMDNFGGTPDDQNLSLAKSISSLDQTLVSRVGFTYTLPKWGPAKTSYLVKDWFINAFFYYASGIPLPAPAANTTGYPSNLASALISNITFQGAPNEVRVPGQPLYLSNLNCHCYDPNTSIVLNPAAWANPAPGQYGGAYYYNDFRGERRPVENGSFGRHFQIRERIGLNIRAEFQNIFNRTYLNNPSITNPQLAPVCKLPSGANGACSGGEQVVSGFGSIATSTLLYQPRTGTLVAQLVF